VPAGRSPGAHALTGRERARGREPAAPGHHAPGIMGQGIMGRGIMGQGIMGQGIMARASWAGATVCF